MSLTKDTPISELMHSESPRTNHKYRKREWKNGRWRYWYEDGEKDERPIGQNYTTPGEDKPSEAADKKGKAEKEDSDLEKKIAKVGRYIEAAKTWIKDIMQTPAIDHLTGKDKPITWQRAKEFVDSKYVDGDQDLLLTDKYLDKKKK